MADTLQQIFAAKAALLEREQRREPYDELRSRALARCSERRDFLGALRGAPGAAIIAEIKRASPSSGLIVRNFNPTAIASVYDGAGVDAISVLTEQEHFLGDLGFLDEVRRVTSRPLLRKDFLSTRYHVAQSAAYGADALLLIVAGIDDVALRACLDEAGSYALNVLVEVHDGAELRRAVEAGADLIGVNNRNLRTLVTDLAVGEHLLPRVPTSIFAIAESGLRKPADLMRLRSAGARGFLIGESLLRAEDPRALIEILRRGVDAHVG